MISRRALKERASLIYQKTNRFEFFSSIFVGLATCALIFIQLMPNMQHIEAFFSLVTLALATLTLLLTYIYIRNQFKKLYDLIEQLCD